MAPPPAPAVDGSTVKQFLTTCIETLQSEETRRVLCRCTSVRPSIKLVEIQKRVWDDLGVPVDAGRKAVNDVRQNYPEEAEALVSLREDFSAAVDAAYLRCLEDRRPTKPDAKGKLAKVHVLEFLDVCHVKLDRPEVRDQLRICVRETGAMPEAAVNELHGDVMELLGFEREHGVKCFQQLGSSQQFANDREVAMAYARWRGKTSSVCFELLNEFRKEGGELHIDDNVAGSLLEFRAKEGLDAMSFDDRSTLLEKHSKRVNVFRGLPQEARKRHMDRLPEQERLELAQAEILMATIVQKQQQEAARASE